MGIFIAYLLGILTALKPKNHHANHDTDSTNTTTQETPTNWPISIVCIPPTESKKERAKKEKNERRETVKFWVELVSAITLLGYFGMTILIWCANKKSADAAEKAASAARDSISLARASVHLDQRAWIAPSVGSYDRSNIAVGFAITNKGKTAALNVDGKIAVWLLVKNERPEFEYAPNSGHPVHTLEGGKIVFPEEVNKMSFGVFDHGKSTINRIAHHLTPAETKNGEFIIIFGCITYSDVFGIPHWIHFCHLFADPQLASTPLAKLPAAIEDCSSYNKVDKNDLPVAP